MERHSRIRALISAMVAAALATAAWSNPLDLDMEPEAVAGIYGAFVTEFRGSEAELGRDILEVARAHTHLDAPAEREAVCVALPGTGGNTRLDGGGNPRFDGGSGTTRGPWGGILLAPFPPQGSGLWPYGPAADHTATFPPLATVDPPLRPMAVIDAFDTAELEGLPNEAALDVDELWRVLVGSQFGRRVEASPALHGNLVLFHLLAPWAAQGGLSLNVDASRRGEGHLRLDVLQAGGWNQSVHLLAIDYRDVTTVVKAMDVARDLPDVVVIASWGLVDCTLAAGYHAEAELGRGSETAPTTFAAYVAAVLERAEGEAEELMAALCEAFADEIALAGGRCPARGLLTVAALAQMNVAAWRATSWEDFGETIVFASAGNQGLPFPMPPAAWPGVVGVEACIAGGTDYLDERAAFSNAGDHLGEPSARALGAWFATEHRSSTGDLLGYWGTSFAAPTAAAAFAASGGWTGNGLQVVAPCEGSE